jgi:hypothetical protein
MIQRMRSIPASPAQLTKSLLRLHRVLLVRDQLAPRSLQATVGRCLPAREVGHEPVRCGAMPVPLAGGSHDGVPRPESRRRPRRATGSARRRRSRERSGRRRARARRCGRPARTGRGRRAPGRAPRRGRSWSGSPASPTRRTGLPRRRTSGGLAILVVCREPSRADEPAGPCGSAVAPSSIRSTRFGRS